MILFDVVLDWIGLILIRVGSISISCSAVLQKMGQNLFGILKSLCHVNISGVHSICEGIMGPFCTFVEEGDDFILTIKKYLGFVGELDLNDFC